jgi:hypothetical protein
MMQATHRQWVAFLQGCKARHIHAAKLRDDVATALGHKSWETMTGTEVGTLIRTVNETDLRDGQAMRHIIERMTGGEPEAA